MTEGGIAPKMFRKASKDDNPPANTWENVDKMDFVSKIAARDCHSGKLI